MSKPIVAIVGRPNVGKSTLFNRLAGEQIAIASDKSGITRDRIYADTDWVGYDFTIIDTGGIELYSKDEMTKQIVKQAQIAIETCDVILFVVDIKVGVTDLDEQVSTILRKSNKPIVMCVNKVDNMQSIDLLIYDFYTLGISEPIPVCASQGLGIGELLDEIVKHFKHIPKESKKEQDSVKVAIIGKPNVGKSSLINKLLGEERLIVSDVPGTTRDSVDTFLTYEGKEYTFIDTAGIRRKSKIKEEIEKYSIIRGVTAIEKADVCVLVINAVDLVTEQDAKIAGIAHERGKGCIILVNKWDLVEKDTKTMKKFEEDIKSNLNYLSYAPILFISAKTGQRVVKLFELIDIVNENRNLRISTGVLNDVITQAKAMHEPPHDKGRMLKIYYATCASVRPPTFILFVNDSTLMHFSYKRYLENQLRKAFGFIGTPIHFILRNRSEKD